MMVVVVFATGMFVLVGGVLAACLLRRVAYVVPVGELHVVERLGRTCGVRRPGVHLRVPGRERLTRLTHRPFAIEVRTGSTTRAGEPVTMRAVVQLRIIDAIAYVEHERVLRRGGSSVIGLAMAATVRRRELADLAHRAELAADLHRSLAEQMARFGLHVEHVVLELTWAMPRSAPALVA